MEVQRGGQRVWSNRMVHNREAPTGRLAADLPLHPESTEIECLARTRLDP
jgi:hypothetical protein